LESTPIKEKDIYQEFEIFYNELMRYADENYLLAEKTMGKQLSTTAFAKAGFKQSFVSSFYSALQRIENRKIRIEEYIQKI
jgi:ABC-type transporter MlaC component